MPGPRKVLHRMLAVALLCLLPFTGKAYDALVAFGDSDTDTGNLPSSPPEYWNKRFSNGPLWVEYLAQRLGVEYDPSSNFAVSGQESTDLGTQIGRFWGPGEAQDVLYAIWAGSNDLLNNLGAGTSDAAWEREISGIVSSLSTGCDLLYKKGARKIMVFNIADLTRLPALRNAYSSSFRSYVLGKIRNCNARIAEAVPGIVNSHPGLQVYFMDLYSDLNYLLDHHTELGFVNATIGVLNSTLTDKSFDGPGAAYVFWDGYHYTTKTHALLAEWIASRLPESLPPPPVITLTSPVEGARFTAPARIQLRATVDPKGNAITRVEFVQNDSVIAALQSLPFEFTWSGVPAGSYSIVARVMDGRGRVAVSAVVNVNVTTPVGTALPAPWQHTDIGDTGQGGTAYVIGQDTFVVNGSGTDIWGGEDAFHFAYQPVSGDCTLVAHVAGVGNTDGFAKAGLMFRSDLSASSANALQFVTPGSGVGFQVRQMAGGLSSYTAGSRSNAPRWLKLERAGDIVRGYESADGQTWTLSGSTTLADFGTNGFYAGLAVTSHNNALLNTSSFDSIRLEIEPPSPPPPVPPTPAYLRVLRLADGRIRLSISGSKTVAYICEASADLQSWTAISTNVNTTGMFVVYDQIPPGAAQRYYRAVASED